MALCRLKAVRPAIEYVAADGADFDEPGTPHRGDVRCMIVGRVHRFAQPGMAAHGLLCDNLGLFPEFAWATAIWPAIASPRAS